MSSLYTTQNDLLLNNLMSFYRKFDNVEKMLNIINGKSEISLRIVDWFATNYAKKYYTVYDIEKSIGECLQSIRFKVYNDYKLKLKAYSKKRFDPFCRWDRITIPYRDGVNIQTTIGQLNFFKWAIENDVVKYIEENYQIIQNDMDSRNSSSRKRELSEDTGTASKSQKTRKKREELSILASKSIKKEDVEIIVSFN
jgi:hypothetical protein